MWNNQGRMACAVTYGMVISCAVFVATPSFGQEWVTLTSATVTGVAESNPELSADNERSNSTYRVNPSIVSRLELPTSSVDLSASVTATRSREQDIQADAEEYELGAGYERDFEESVFSLDADISLEEFANSSFDDAQALSAVDSTESNEDDSILRFDLASGYRQGLTDTLTMDTGFDYSIAEFSEDSRTDFSDYRVDSRFDLDVSLLTTMIAVVGAQYFDPRDLQATKVGRFSGGVEHEFGADHTITAIGGVAATAGRISYIVDVSYQKLFEDFAFAASLTNDVSPDDDGELAETARADLVVTQQLMELTELQSSLGYSKSDTIETILATSTLSHDYNEDMRVSLTGSYRVTENSGGVTTLETTQVVAAPSLNWQLNEELTTVLRYDEIFERSDTDGNAESRRGTVTIIYSLPPF